MTVHRRPCPSLTAHIRRELPVADRSEIATFLRLATVEYDREHGVATLEPVDAEDRIHALLGYAPGELTELHGK